MAVKFVGIVVIVLGALALSYGGFRFAYPDNVANVGPVHVSVQKHATVFVPPLLGVLAIGAGIAVLVANPRKA